MIDDASMVCPSAVVENPKRQGQHGLLDKLNCVPTTARKMECPFETSKFKLQTKSLFLDLLVCRYGSALKMGVVH